jgi:hypothetical protein
MMSGFLAGFSDFLLDRSLVRDTVGVCRPNHWAVKLINGIE